MEQPVDGFASIEPPDITDAKLAGFEREALAHVGPPYISHWVHAIGYEVQLCSIDTELQSVVQFFTGNTDDRIGQVAECTFGFRVHSPPGRIEARVESHECVRRVDSSGLCPERRDARECAGFGAVAMHDSKGAELAQVGADGSRGREIHRADSARHVYTDAVEIGGRVNLVEERRLGAQPRIRERDAVAPLNESARQIDDVPSGSAAASFEDQ
jgi:hypothetical protein